MTCGRMQTGKRGRWTGFSLVEVMVALLVIAVGFTALLASVVVGLDNAQKTNAELTGHMAARGLVDLIEAHYSVPLDGLVFNDVSVLKTGNFNTNANNPYITYYVPGSPSVGTQDYKMLYRNAMVENIVNSGATALTLPNLYFKVNDNDDSGVTPSDLPTSEAPPTSSHVLPTRWVGGSHTALAGDGSSNANFWAIGPYRLMAEFENLSEEQEISNTAVPFKTYKITVWVFGLDFPKNRTARHYATSGRTQFAGYDSDPDDALKQRANRAKEALGVYTFTTRLGKAIAPFR